MTQRSMHLVAAVADGGAIGRDNTLPWRLPADLRHFRRLTLGRSILMGRKTYESIGKALPDRHNIVLSRSSGFSPSDCSVVATLQAALDVAHDEHPLMVIGGAEIYRLCLPQANRIHLTRVRTSVEGADAFFSGWRDPAWRTLDCEEHAADAVNPYAYSFHTLERI